MKSAGKLPSELLGRKFELPDRDANAFVDPDEIYRFRGHAFVLDNMRLLLETEKTVCEVFDSLALCRLPNTPPWLHGIANQRGNMVPIFDLHLLFALKRAGRDGKKKQKYLIFGQKESAVGMLIEDLPVRVDLDPEERMSAIPPLPAKLQPYVRLCYRHEGKLWIAWDVQALFAAVSGEIA